MRLLVIAAVACVAYHVLFKDGGLIKNAGTVGVEPYADEEEQHAAPEQAHEASPPQPAAVGPQHAQVDDVSQERHDDMYKTNPNVLPHAQISNDYAPQGNFKPDSSHNFGQFDCFPKDQLVPGDLLPRDGGFEESNPAPNGQLANRNLFESAHHSGLNTQGSSLRIANLQIRSNPLIARVDVGPWNQSTVETDTNRRTLEIGGD